jgi:transcriptional regulator with XRE-family HTH domain
MMTLKTLRETKNLTQQELAQIVGVSRKTISAYETGRAVPSVRVLKELAKVLDTPIDSLLKSIPVETKKEEVKI